MDREVEDFLARMKRARYGDAAPAAPPATKPKRARAKRASPTRPWLPDGTRLLALDVSSTAMGWALWTRQGVAAHLERSGLCRPKKAGSVSRIFEIGAAACALIPRTRPTVCLFEWSAGHVHGGIKRRMDGLAILGQAQGYVLAVVYRGGNPIELVPEAEWTGGTPKKKRAELVRLEHPDYAARAALDPGMDEADAIGLGRWRMSQGYPDEDTTP